MENNVNEDQNDLSIREFNFTSLTKKSLIFSLLCIVLFYIVLFFIIIVPVIK